MFYNTLCTPIFCLCTVRTFVHYTYLRTYLHPSRYFKISYFSTVYILILLRGNFPIHLFILLHILSFYVILHISLPTTSITLQPLASELHDIQRRQSHSSIVKFQKIKNYQKF